MAVKEIPMRIRDESEIFSPMDPEQNLLSEDAINYLTRVFINKHRRLRENYVIRIISDVPLDAEHVKQTILKEFDRQKDDIHFALRRLMVKLVSLAVLGAAILSLWLYLSNTFETVGVEILSIMGWVCIWEATSIGVLQRPELRRLWFNLDRLTRAEIIVRSVSD